MENKEKQTELKKSNTGYSVSNNNGNRYMVECVYAGGDEIVKYNFKQKTFETVDLVQKQEKEYIYCANYDTAIECIKDKIRTSKSYPSLQLDVVGLYKVVIDDERKEKKVPLQSFNKIKLKCENSLQDDLKETDNPEPDKTDKMFNDIDGASKFARRDYDKGDVGVELPDFLTDETPISAETFSLPDIDDDYEQDEFETNFIPPVDDTDGIDDIDNNGFEYDPDDTDESESNDYENNYEFDPEDEDSVETDAYMVTATANVQEDDDIFINDPTQDYPDDTNETEISVYNDDVIPENNGVSIPDEEFNEIFREIDEFLVEDETDKKKDKTETESNETKDEEDEEIYELEEI